MTKYNTSFKQQAIEFYLQNAKNRSLTCQHFQLKKTTFERWLSQYNHYGINGLVVRGKKQKYSLDFKLSVIQAVQNGQCSAREAGLRFGIASSSVISQWLQRFDRQGIKGLQPKPKGHLSMNPNYPKMPPPSKTEEERLRYRILELEAEVAILKKLQELNQQKMRKKPGSSKS